MRWEFDTWPHGRLQFWLRHLGNTLSLSAVCMLVPTLHVSQSKWPKDLQDELSRCFQWHASWHWLPHLQSSNPKLPCLLYSVELLANCLKSVWSRWHFSPGKLACHRRRKHLIKNVFWRALWDNVVIERISWMATSWCSFFHCRWTNSWCRRRCTWCWRHCTWSRWYTSSPNPIDAIEAGSAFICVSWMPMLTARTTWCLAMLVQPLCCDVCMTWWWWPVFDGICIYVHVIWKDTLCEWLVVFLPFQNHVYIFHVQ